MRVEAGVMLILVLHLNAAANCFLPFPTSIPTAIKKDADDVVHSTAAGSHRNEGESVFSMVLAKLLIELRGTCAMFVNCDCGIMVKRTSGNPEDHLALQSHRILSRLMRTVPIIAQTAVMQCHDSYVFVYVQNG
jgi:hypothetical protein